MLRNVLAAITIITTLLVFTQAHAQQELPMNSKRTGIVPVAIWGVTDGKGKHPEEILKVAKPAVEGAIDYWNTTLPFSYTLVLSQSELLFYPGRVDTYELLFDAPAVPGAINLYFVDTEKVSERTAWSAAWLGKAMSTIRTDRLAGLIAHELGHVLYNLPDLYGPNSETYDPFDIMDGDVMFAYRNKSLGCRTRINLGLPCYQVRTPMVKK